MIPINKQIAALIVAAVQADTDLSSINYNGMLAQLTLPEIADGVATGFERNLDAGEAACIGPKLYEKCYQYKEQLNAPEPEVDEGGYV